VNVQYRWSGILGFTPDRLPLVGTFPGRPGLGIAVGYSGHGVSMAFICGHMMAQRLLGQATVIPACFNPQRHLAEPDPDLSLDATSA
jgi:glycine/D-amino acid oxidase-like deaminating enzyme